MILLLYVCVTHTHEMQPKVGTKSKLKTKETGHLEKMVDVTKFHSFHAYKIATQLDFLT